MEFKYNGYELKSMADLVGDKIYRYLVYKKLFTPYEQKSQFIDETQFECDEYSFGRIVDIFVTPDNECLIKFQEVDPEDGESNGTYEYHLLSNIQLTEFDCDNYPEGEDE